MHKSLEGSNAMGKNVHLFYTQRASRLFGALFRRSRRNGWRVWKGVWNWLRVKSFCMDDFKNWRRISIAFGAGVYVHAILSAAVHTKVVRKEGKKNIAILYFTQLEPLTWKRSVASGDREKKMNFPRHQEIVEIARRQSRLEWISLIFTFHFSFTFFPTCTWRSSSLLPFFASPKRLDPTSSADSCVHFANAISEARNQQSAF